MNALKKAIDNLQYKLEVYLTKAGFGMRGKLIIIFLLAKVIPLILLAVIAWRQITLQGDLLRDISVKDSTVALNNSAVENIERMSRVCKIKCAFAFPKEEK